MSNSQPGTQSAAERRSAEAEVRTLIAKIAPAHLRLIGAVRRWLRKRLPTAHELAYEYRDWFVISYSPNEHGYEGTPPLFLKSTLFGRGPDYRVVRKGKDRMTDFTTAYTIANNKRLCQSFLAARCRSVFSPGANRQVKMLRSDRSRILRASLPDPFEQHVPRH